MNFLINNEENITTVKVDETRLDASVAPDFKQKMEDIINEGNDQIILDISKITFMDSSSLGAMVAVLKAMGSHGKLVIQGASGVVLELFKLTRMDRVFTLKEDAESALEVFAEAV